MKSPPHPFLFLFLFLSLSSSLPLSSPSPSSPLLDTDTPPHHKFLDVSLKVKRLEWDHTMTEEEFVSTILSQPNPLILTSSPATEWFANGRWKPSFLQERIPVLDKIRRGTSRTFVYETSSSRKPLASFHQSKKELVEMPSIEFFKLMTEEKKKKTEHDVQTNETNPDHHHHHHYYYYYSVKLENEKGFGGLSDDLEPHDFLLVDDVTPKLQRYPFLRPRVPSPSLLNHSVNVWMGRDVVAQSHYDPTQNFFYQVLGKKTWYLSSPDHYLRYFFFPWAHPCERQSQLGLEGDRVFEDYGRPNALLAELLPGELLYVPPYWIHMVEVEEEFSLSVNFWSTSFYGYVADQLIAAGLPDELVKNSSPKEASKNVAYFVKHLIKTVRSYDKYWQPRLFVEAELVRNRYSLLLLPPSRCADGEFDENKCPRDGNLSKETKDKLDDKIAELHEIFGVYQKESLNKRKGSTDLEAEERSRIGFGVQSLELLDYVERVVGFVMQGEDMCVFLRCLATQGWMEDSEKAEEEEAANKHRSPLHDEL